MFVPWKSGPDWLRVLTGGGKCYFKVRKSRKWYLLEISGDATVWGVWRSKWGYLNCIVLSSLFEVSLAAVDRYCFCLPYSWFVSHNFWARVVTWHEPGESVAFSRALERDPGSEGTLPLIWGR